MLEHSHGDLRLYACSSDLCNPEFIGSFDMDQTRREFVGRACNHRDIAGHPGGRCCDTCRIALGKASTCSVRAGSPRSARLTVKKQFPPAISFAGYAFTGSLPGCHFNPTNRVLGVCYTMDSLPASRRAQGCARATSPNLAAAEYKSQSQGRLYRATSVPRYICIWQVKAYSPALLGVMVSSTGWPMGKSAAMPRSSNSTFSAHGLGSLRRKRSVTGWPGLTSIRAGVYTPPSTMTSITPLAARCAFGFDSQNHQTMRPTNTSPATFSKVVVITYLRRGTKSPSPACGRRLQGRTTPWMEEVRAHGWAKVEQCRSNCRERRREQPPTTPWMGEVERRREQPPRGAE